MKDLFQRLKNGDTTWVAKSAAARLTLAAFGKHPGWDDHILGIGVETETLAQVKQALYVGGIGGQIDSGAWEKLEPEKRLVGYDHTFLWLRPGHVIVGQLWSSTDGKKRPKYPMVLCIDGEAVAPGFMVAHVLPGLERLREACKATTSADQVTKDCQAAQGQLRAILSSADARSAETPLSAEARRHFLERPELGPERLGFLRVLHELGTAFSPSANGRRGKAGTAESHSRHLRLPLVSESRAETLLLWGEFFHCAIPDAVPLLLISRAGVNWMDVIIGEPASDDFFCLQASNKGMPLATEIPYELPLELRLRFQDLEAKFLGVPPPVASVVTASDTKAETPAAPGVTNSPEPAKARRKWTSSLFIISGVVLLVAAGSLWLSGRWSGSTKAEARVPSASNKPNSQPPLAKAEQDYRNAFTEAQRAWSATNLDQAIAQAQLALTAKPGDAAAGNLLQLAQQRKTELAKTEEYRSTMDAARVAFQQKDFVTAMTRAGAALVIKSNDPAAKELRATAKKELDLAEQVKVRGQKYQTAMKEGQTALDGKDYTNAIVKANVALAIKPNDPVATRLKAEAQTQINLAAVAKEREQRYQTAMKEEQTAFNGKDYATAIAKADVALAIKPNDSAATKLRADAHKLLNLARQEEDLRSARVFFDQGDYATSLKLCHSHAAVAAFDSLAESSRTEQTAFNDANVKFTEGDYSFTDRLKNQNYSGKKPFADLVANAMRENGVLEELKALQKATNWSAVKARLSDVAFQKKPPFTALAAWAETQKQIAPRQSLEKLDSDFEVMLVWFDILDPAKAQFSEARTNVPIRGQILPEEADRCAAKAKYLEIQFKKGGWLTPAREKNLKELKKAIVYHS